MNWSVTLMPVVAVTMITASAAQVKPAHPALAIAFLYDVTISAVGVVSELAPVDTLRFGFIARHLYLSRPYTATETTDFYRKVVGPTLVSASDRLGPSPIWDAIDGAISLLASQNGRRAVIVMTDGLSTGNVHSVADVVNHAKLAGVSISGIFAGNPFVLWTEWPVHPGQTLTAMAADTGGVYVVPEGEQQRESRQIEPVAKKSLNTAVKRIFEKLRD
jgi:hypothetical protein